MANTVCEFVTFVFSAICQSPSFKGDLHDEKMMIIAFLSRVMHGKQLGKLLQQGTELGRVHITLQVI